MRRLLFGLAVFVLVVAGLAAVMAFRAAGLPSARLDAPAPAPIEDLSAATAPGGIARKLSEAIRIPTITLVEGREDADPAAFETFRRWLEESFPLVHETLERERINEHALLYRWPGAQPETSGPVAFVAHQDVVPVEPGTLEDWRYPPFAGTIADGFVWGRGALDMKNTLVALMEAAERRIADGFEPAGDIYFLLGHDEETGGEEGMAAMARLLSDRGVRLAWTLDEGSVILSGEAALGIEPDVALVSVGEKGYATLALTAKGEGGHSSIPPRQTAVSRVGDAVARLHRRPFPLHLDGPTAELVKAIAAEHSFAARMAAANLWLTRPLLAWALASDPTMAAMLRTTTAATVIEGGTAENVLPQEARALVNFRIHPADSVSSVMDRVRRIAGDEETLRVALAGVSQGYEPSPLSDQTSPGYVAVMESLGEVFGPIVAAPALTVAGTDSKHLVGIADNTFRFSPMRLVAEDLGRIHGTDERMDIEGLVRMVQFYEGVLTRTGRADP